jgi:HTH-type transcriptional regulator/antitoxin MqsA
MKACPVCGGELRRETRKVPYTYRDDTFMIEQPGEYCRHCGEAFLGSDDLKATRQLIADHKRDRDRLLRGDQVRAIRQKLDLTQASASEIFGGGIRAFHKYETGESIQSRPLDILLRLIDRGKVSLDEIREVAGGR